MYCPKCGKEIPDDSKFCYSCGSKIEINETQDTLTDTTPLVVDKKIQTETKDIKQTISEKIDEQVVPSTVHTTILQKIKKLGWGGLVLVCLYMGYVLKSTNTSLTLTLLSIITLGLFIIIVFYYWFLNFLLKNEYHFQIPIMTPSFISGVFSFFLIGLLVSGSIGLIEGYHKRCDVEKFMKNYQPQIEVMKKQETEYSKMMGYEPKTKAEVNDKILKVDEYKIHQTKKNKVLINMINLFRETNSKYKKSKTVDEQINKLEKILNDNSELFIDSLDWYKKYLITGDEKYFNIYEQKFEKVNSSKDEVNKLFTSIGKSL
jgi:hypothetical protein